MGHELESLTVRAETATWPTLGAKLADMARLADEGAGDPYVRHLALRALRDAGVQHADLEPEAAARALDAYALRRWTYARERGEQLESPRYTLQGEAADCDGYAIALAAMAGSIELPWRFELDTYDDGTGHVWVNVAGVRLDPTDPGRRRMENGHVVRLAGSWSDVWNWTEENVVEPVGSAFQDAWDEAVGFVRGYLAERMRAPDFWVKLVATTGACVYSFGSACGPAVSAFIAAETTKMTEGISDDEWDAMSVAERAAAESKARKSVGNDRFDALVAQQTDQVMTSERFAEEMRPLGIPTDLSDYDRSVYTFASEAMDDCGFSRYRGTGPSPWGVGGYDAGAIMVFVNAAGENATADTKKQTNRRTFVSFVDPDAGCKELTRRFGWLPAENASRWGKLYNALAPKSIQPPEGWNAATTLIELDTRAIPPAPAAQALALAQAIGPLSPMLPIPTPTPETSALPATEPGAVGQVAPEYRDGGGAGALLVLGALGALGAAIAARKGKGR